MHAYLQSASARIARITLGLGIVAAGLVALVGPADGLYVIAAAPPFLIVGGIFAVGLAVPAHRKAAFALVFGLPLIAGPYGALLYAALRFGAAAGLALAAIGAAVIAAALVNPILRAERREEAHA